jgi:acyl-CoA synthetase (NDP forming)
MAAHQPVPRGGRILVMTSSGAGASLMADKATEYGLDLADISEEAKSRVPQRRTAILTNPFDTAGASRSPGFLSNVCEAFAGDTANDCLLMYLGPLAVRHEYARNFAAASAKFGKPAAAINCLSEADVRDIFQAQHIPVFDGATDACFKMLRSYIDYGRFLAGRSKAQRAEHSSNLPPANVEAILKAHDGASMLPHSATMELLAAYGFRCVDFDLVSNRDEAMAVASKIGYPVIMKGIVHDVAHRSDIGLVSRKVSSDAELQREYEALAERARVVSQENPVISVERYVPHGFEVILGVKYDATFGPVILCGLGGTFTEVLKDYALRLAPLTATEARNMRSSLRAFPVLHLSSLAIELRGKISTIDINPLGLSSDSSHLTVLDAKIHV